MEKLQNAWQEIQNEDPEKRDAKQVSKKPKVVQLFGGRQLIMSEQLSKINQNNWTQSRTFVITEDKIFNIDNTKSKREMLIASLDGLSRSMLGKKPEFTIHFRKEYDYRFACDAPM